jgi:hypothetical protein
MSIGLDEYCILEGDSVGVICRGVVIMSIGLGEYCTVINETFRDYF